MAKLVFFFVFFEKIMVVCGCSAVLLGVANFFVITLHALNSISAIILLAILKTAKLEFLSVFFEQIRVVWGCSTVL